MAIGTQDNSDDMLSEINMIPFIDVMLVLLIIFMITVPVIQHAVNIDLPQASNQQLVEKPGTVRLTVNAEGSYLWDDQSLADAELDHRLAAAAALQPQPELHIQADKNVRYERVALAMATAQRSGLRKIGFVTEPEAATQ
jgi:biopolymer transport protein ExbD